MPDRPARPLLPYALTLLIIGITIAALRFEGRIWWCTCGRPRIWISNVWSEHCSQHLLDPYSVSHMEHGLVFTALLAIVAKRWPASWRFLIAIAIECGWEVLENSSLIIERYRKETMSLNYLGDSIANSLGDIMSCGLGFAIARKLGWKWSILAFLAGEIIMLGLIRDNLTLNVIMLLHPIHAIKDWQSVGHAPG